MVTDLHAHLWLKEEIIDSGKHKLSRLGGRGFTKCDEFKDHVTV